MSRLSRGIVFALALVGFGVGARAPAQTLPAVHLVTAPMVSPTAAWAFYGNPTVHTNGVAASAALLPEFTALAVSLGCPGPDTTSCRVTPAAYTQNVFDYVRNNIATEFRFGLSKGGQGALIDQSGTAFDQAQLMVKLLGQAGITATYQVGTITLTPTQFGHWTGLVQGLGANQNFTVNAAAACQFLADGGIPAIVNGSSDCTQVSGAMTSVTIGHIWVQSGGLYYDPAYKQFNLKPGINIGTVLGQDPNAACGSAGACASAAVTATMTGAISAPVAGNAAYKNLNAAALTTKMNIYAVAIENGIRSSVPNGPNFQLDDVIGGSEIDLTYAPTGLPALPSNYTPQYTWNTDQKVRTGPESAMPFRRRDGDADAHDHRLQQRTARPDAGRERSLSGGASGLRPTCGRGRGRPDR